jgi:hypothetical protein
VVGRLSGGEQARIHIARLMQEPADLLVLDEPTNDLDIPTLDVLEESLTSFEGGLVLVTHDRFMLDRVATGIVALDGLGGTEKFADYAQWEAARVRPLTSQQPLMALARSSITLSPEERGNERRRGRGRKAGVSGAASRRHRGGDRGRDRGGARRAAGRASRPIPRPCRTLRGPGRRAAAG